MSGLVAESATMGCDGRGESSINGIHGRRRPIVGASCIIVGDANKERLELNTGYEVVDVSKEEPLADLPHEKAPRHTGFSMRVAPKKFVIDPHGSAKKAA